MQVKKKSQKQEKRIAKEFNGNTVVASGALWDRKGDVRTKNYLIECKTTDKSFYPLKAEIWEKIENEALMDSMRMPLMCISLENGAEDYVVFSIKHFDVTRLCTLYHPKVGKSYRIKKGIVGYFDDFGNYIHGIQFDILHKRENVLYCMQLDDFKEQFGKDIEI